MASISLCMIVRDEAGNLAACVEPLRDLVSEIVVVDTGSTDQTRSIAESLGAKVYDFPWIDDFAAARNASLDHATGDWIFWMDADDRLDPVNRNRLRQLFSSVGEQRQAFRMSVLSRQGDQQLTLDHVRLFRRAPEIRWRGAVHEQIIPALEEAGHARVPSEIVIFHQGYAAPAVPRRKLERNCRLLEKA